MRKSMFFKALMLSGAIVMASSASAGAQDLNGRLSDLLTNHERIRAAMADLESARANVEIARGGYYPTASVTANWGNERIYTESSNETSSMAQREVDLGLSQTLYDFGATGATVSSAELAVRQADTVVKQTKQQILLAALSAELNVASAKRVLDFQNQSVASIKRQTELEDARVQRGSGFSTDVLQAKTQLAGAQAAQVRAKGTLEQSINRYRAVYGEAPTDMSALGQFTVDPSSLPTGVDDVVKAAMEENFQIRVSELQSAIADTEVERSFAAGYRPTVTASADHKYKRDVGGTQQKKRETLVKVELTYDFNFGFTAANTLKAAKAGHNGAASRLRDARHQTEEQARNAWQALETARINADHLTNQANIAAEFLELARKERTLGQRSLIDVLSGETALINAQAAADRAKTDLAIARLRVLSVMGQLDLSVLR